MRIAILVLAALASSVFGCEQTIVSCTNSKITSNVAIVTDPAWSEVSNGVTYTSQTAFTLSQAVNSGKSHLKVLWNGISVKDETTDLCADLKSMDTGIQCPLSGDLLSTATETVSGLPSSGTIVSTMTWTDNASGEAFLCIQSTNCM